jgi:hypothetical protein
MIMNFQAIEAGLLTVNSRTPNFRVFRAKRLSGFYKTRRSTSQKKSIVASIVAVKNRTFPVPSSPTGNPILQRKPLPFPTGPNGTFRPGIFANETLYQLSYTPRSTNGIYYARAKPEGKQKSGAENRRRSTLRAGNRALTGRITPVTLLLCRLWSFPRRHMPACAPNPPNHSAHPLSGIYATDQSSGG